MNNPFEIFDAWEDLAKAKAKGISKWDKLQNVADKLAGKTSRDITFTALNPDGSTTKHVLGSKEGNLKALMGYINPGFSWAAYHELILDPNLTEEEAKEIYTDRGHPANPKFWIRHKQEPFPEGDQTEGKPHPDFYKASKQVEREAPKTITILDKFGIYIADPEEGILVGAHNDHTYLWELVDGTHFAATHPDLAAAMNGEETETQKSLVQEYAKPFKGTSWDDDAYELVKSKFPTPGSVVSLGPTLRAVFTTNSVDFIDIEDGPVEVEVFDKSVTGLPLTVGGDVYPSVIVNFAKSFLNIGTEELLNFVTSKK